jgi:hypothetical protein
MDIVQELVAVGAKAVIVAVRDPSRRAVVRLLFSFFFHFFLSLFEEKKKPAPFSQKKKRLPQIQRASPGPPARLRRLPGAARALPLAALG